MIFKDIRTGILLLLFLLPLCAITCFNALVYQSAHMAHFPISLFAGPVYRAFFYMDHQTDFQLSKPLLQLSAILVLAAIMCVIRVFFMDKALRSRILFHKGSIWRLIPNILISVVSFAITALFVFNQLLFSPLKLSLPVSQAAFFLVVFFFSALCLYATSAQTIRLKLMLRQRTKQESGRKLIRHFISHLGYGLLLAGLLFALVRLINHMAGAWQLFTLKDFRFFALALPAWAFVAGCLYGALKNLQEHRWPVRFFVYLALIAGALVLSKPLWQPQRQPAPHPAFASDDRVTRRLMLGNQVRESSYMPITRDRNVLDNLELSASLIRRLKDNLITREELWRLCETRTPRCFDAMGLTRIHRVSFDRKMRLRALAEQPKLSIAAALYLCHAMVGLCCGQEIEPLFAKTAAVYEKNARAGYIKERQFSARIIDIKQALAKPAQCLTYTIKGRLTINHPGSHDKLRFALGLVSQQDYGFLQTEQGGKADWWDFCDPLVPITPGSFQLSDILAGDYRLLLVIDDPVGQLAGYDDVRSNLQMLAIASPQDEAFSLIVDCQARSEGPEGNEQ